MNGLKHWNASASETETTFYMNCFFAHWGWEISRHWTACGYWLSCFHPPRASVQSALLRYVPYFFFGTQRRRSHFFTPRPRPYFPCLLSCLVSSIERLSLHGSPNWKIMDLINWSLNAIDTIFSSRSLGAGEPDCPDGTFAAGYTMDAWERWRIVCLAALSVEDIEDIYLFGTMITGILLIGLGFALGYRRILKTGTAVQSLTRLPVMIEAVGRVVSIETETINRNMDSIMEKLTALQRQLTVKLKKLTVLETRMDKESSRGIGMRLLALRQNNRNLIFFGSLAQWPWPRSLLEELHLGRPLQWDALASSPILQTLIINYYYTHTHTYLPSPDPSPPSLWTASLTGGSVASAENGCRTGWLPAGAGLLPLWQKSCVYGLCTFCCWGVFPVLTLYSPRSIVWGLFFLSSPSSCYAVFFSSIPCLPFLSTPLSYMYVVYVWTGWWLISLVLVTSDNKGLLLLLTVPDVQLVTYLNKTIPVLGCLAFTVIYQSHHAQASFYIVPGGTPLLGMDLFTALHLDIRNGYIASSEGNGQVAVNYTEPLGSSAGFLHKVNVRSDVPPVQQKLRRLLFAVRDAVSQEIKRLESEGIIEKVDSTPWESPLVAIQKKSGGIRLFVDLREPNKAVIIDSHPLPHIEEVFTELRGASMFSTIDLQNAYHQVTLHQDSRDVTAFVTHDGLYHFTWVPYGLASAPSAFQRMMLQILAGQDVVQYYLDDIIVNGDNPELHEKRLQSVLQRLQNCGLKLNVEKCRFRKSELPFLGHVISASGLHPNPDHVLAIQQAPPPHDARSLHSFLGLAGLYSKFIPNNATLVEPLCALLRKSIGFCWTDEAQENFNRLKHLITTSSALALFDPSLPTTVTTDASDFGIGAVLTQSHGATERTVAFASRTLSDCERKYSTTEKEALACVWATEKWCTYLWGRHFTLCTDHSPLSTLLSTKGLGRAGMRLGQWSARLLCFNYSMKYKPGQDNVTADCPDFLDMMLLLRLLWSPYLLYSVVREIRLNL